jgi:hypothetical protein
LTTWPSGDHLDSKPPIIDPDANDLLNRVELNPCLRTLGWLRCTGLTNRYGS